MPRMGGMPTYDNRTMTAAHLKRRPPMWVVAALSCSIALLLAGIVVAIFAATGSSSSPTPTRAEGSAHPSSTAPAASPSPGGGPFTSARTAFNTVTSSPGPTSAVPPAGLAPPALIPPPVAPPVMGATPTEPPAAPPAAAPAAAAAPAQPAAVAVAKPEPPRATGAPVAKPEPPPAAKPEPPKKPAALGAITVVCMPKCDQIIDNGTPLGPGHIFNRPVPSGRHTLALSAPNGVKKNLVVEVAPEQTREVRIPMDK
jgi:hypothetical protein